MKTFLIVLIVVVVIGGGFFYFNNYIYEEKQGEQTRNSAEGIVTAVDTNGVAADGPALVTVRTSDDSAAVIAIPSMGLPLCAAVENIDDVFAVEVGNSVSALGDVDPAGRIVPCESSEHFFRIE